MKKNNSFYRKKGFSLIEIVTAVGMLGLVIVTVCGVFIHGLNAIKKSKYRACALHIAEQKFSEVEEVDLGNNSGIPIDKISIPPATGGYIEGFDHCDPPAANPIPWNDLTKPEYKIYGKQHMENILYTFTITIDGYDINLKRITVQVTWHEVEGTKKVTLCKLISRTM